MIQFSIYRVKFTMLKLISPVSYSPPRLWEHFKWHWQFTVYFNWSAQLLFIEVISVFRHNRNLVLDKDWKHRPPGVTRQPLIKIMDVCFKDGCLQFPWTRKKMRWRFKHHSLIECLEIWVGAWSIQLFGRAWAPSKTAWIPVWVQDFLAK